MVKLKVRSLHKHPKELREASQDQVFWVCNGMVLRNLKQLSEALGIMSDETFGNHVSREKNDFVQWISNVLRDDELVELLAHARSREVAHQIIEKHLFDVYNVQ